MSMRKPSGKSAALFAGTVLLLLLTGIVGGESVLADSFSKDALKAGSWSLQFGIDKEFRLEPYDGTWLSCKRH